MIDFDAVVIGSGLGGLSCGAILAKEGFRVAIVEQHSVVGGCLQSFVRDGQVFDTGIHYIGSMGQGQIMRQFLKYYGILDQINALPVDPDAYETVIIGDQQFRLPIGKDRFVKTLGDLFPDDADGLRRVIDLVMEVKDAISVDVLRQGRMSIVDMQHYMAISADEVICSHVKNPTLRGILSSCSMLFGGEKETACFYHYAMVMGSNIEGSYRFVGGTQRLADALANVVKQAGGQIFTSDAVRRIAVNDGTVSHVETRSGMSIKAKYYISSVHPKQTFALLDQTPVVKKAFLNRINDLRNSYGLFSVYLTLKPQAIPFQNTFFLIHPDSNTWFDQDALCQDPSHLSLLFSYKPSSDFKWASSASIIMPVTRTEFSQWADSRLGHRAPEYEAYKMSLANILIQRVEDICPGFKSSVDKVFTASPLTFRDYTSTPEGSAYGILKNCRNPLPTIIPTQTKLGNLLLTGQSIFVPGAIGVTMTAAITCSTILGEEYLAKAIANA